MEKIIDINGQAVRFVSNGATPLLYRQTFGKDLFAVMQGVGEASTKGELPDTEPLIKAAYIMAKQGDPEIPELMEWLAGFEMMDLVLIMPKIIELWGMSNATLSQSKKKSGRRSGL